MATSLIDFLRSGRLGSAEFNIHIDEFVRQVGIPEYYSDMEIFRQDVASMKRFSDGRFVLGYENIEFHFEDDRLVFFIMREWKSGSRGYSYPDPLDINWFDTLFGMNAKTLKNLAVQHNIAYEEMLVPDLRNNVLGIWFPESHVLVTFKDPNGSAIYSVCREERKPQYPQPD